MKAFISYGIMGVVVVLLLLASNPSGATPEGNSVGGKKTIFTKHFQNTLFDISEHAAYSVELLPDDKEYEIGKNVIGLVIHDAHDKDIIGAEITFALTDRVTGKNSLVTPMITDKGNGLYIVSGLDLQKQGKWELAIRIKKDQIEDSVKFNLPETLKERVPKGKYSP